MGQDHAHRVHIRAGIHRSPARLLRRHVRGGPGDGARLRLTQIHRQAEVHDHHAPRPGQHHVLRLEVPVNETGLVDGLEAHRNWDAISRAS